MLNIELDIKFRKLGTHRPYNIYFPIITLLIEVNNNGFHPIL